MKALHLIAFILIIVGSLNWLFIGLFDTDFVLYLGATVAKVVYIVVGLAAIFEVFTHKSICRNCGACGDCGTCSTDNKQA